MAALERSSSLPSAPASRAVRAAAATATTIPDARTLAEGLLRQTQARTLALSVIVPTLDEAGNVLQLFLRLQATLAHVEWEVIFVDDGSSDGTAEILTAMAQRDRRVRLIRRFGRRGLSSAVIEGMLASTAPVVAVIDADLQHDETILPRLLEAVEEGGCDLAVGSRYAPGGSTGDWSGTRAAISRVATRLAELVCRAKLTDPMSGFFAVRRDTIVAAVPRLSGTGYKILLDLVASSPQALRISEVSYRFQPRQAGQSKLDALVTLEYLQLLLDKSLSRFVPPRAVSAIAMGSLRLGVYLLLLGCCLEILTLPFALAVAAATGAMAFCDIAFDNLLSYRGRMRTGRERLAAAGMSCAIWGLGATINVAGADLVHAHWDWWFAGAVGFAVGGLWHFFARNSFGGCRVA